MLNDNNTNNKHYEINNENKKKSPKRKTKTGHQNCNLKKIPDTIKNTNKLGGCTRLCSMNLINYRFNSTYEYYKYIQNYIR